MVVGIAKNYHDSLRALLIEGMGYWQSWIFVIQLFLTWATRSVTANMFIVFNRVLV